ncbi:hypothetical protein CLTEP_02460 [Clostridium tepidiprofundi DSM 19306]|uniref:HNH endonuclease n=1 Tax=Clostridium tepidiprofundi DSM 19306 TaxID=1121338 RepID=A0A151B7R9_9CLOT|nr:HNH endonuclease signature motif containing protein [Clostridium tepidiprofundi]KYH35853.1 hypothetical protein CLTEP_02460 [Clostridium tepidiprofundi DSM 19306]
MNKKIYSAVMERANGYCEVCNRYFGEKLQLHHIVSGTGKRQKYETLTSCIAVCIECHNEIHSNRKLDLALKKLVQEKYFRQGLNEKEVREKMGGRIY